MLCPALLEGISITKNSLGFEIEFDSTALEPAIRKIIKDAIETFVEDSTAVLTVDGVVLEDMEQDGYRALIAWDAPWARSAEELDKFEEWIKQQRAEMTD
jgi:hypothetical protein